MLFNNKKKYISTKDDATLIPSLEFLQNDICSAFATKVIGLLFDCDDNLANQFALAYAEAFAKNNEKTLIIDANLYYHSISDKEDQIIPHDNFISFYVPKSPAYKSEYFKGSNLKNLIASNEQIFNHFIIIFPNVIKHRDAALSNDLIDHSILLIEKNKTPNKSVYLAIDFCKEYNLKLAKTIILK